MGKRGKITDPKILERLKLAREKGLATRRKNAALKKEKNLLAQMQAKKEAMRVKGELAKALVPEPTSGASRKPVTKPEVKPEPKVEPEKPPEKPEKPPEKPVEKPEKPAEVTPLPRPILVRQPPARKLTIRERRQEKRNAQIARLVAKYMY